MKVLKYLSFLVLCCLSVTFASCDDDGISEIVQVPHSGQGQGQNPETKPVKPDESIEWDYPAAEWDKAGTILMHTPGEDGTFIEPENVDQMTEYILKTGKKTDEMKDKCRSYAVARYSLDTYYKKQMEIYEELL